MEELILQYESARRALKTLIAILKRRYSVIVRDATIQRFEYTFEVFWKFVKRYLEKKHGILSGSPKGCFRELFALQLASAPETELLLKMVNSRNETSHTYNEGVAARIYKDIRSYAPLMDRLLDLIGKSL